MSYTCGICERKNSHFCKTCIVDAERKHIPSNFKSAAVKMPIRNMNYEDKPEDLINKPNHYHKNEIDVNGYLEKHFPLEGEYTVAEGFYIGNVIKYTSRYKQKNGLQDLMKAEFNLKKLMELEEKNG